MPTMLMLLPRHRLHSSRPSHRFKCISLQSQSMNRSRMALQGKQCTHFTTSSSSVTAAIIHHQPPLPIRTLLVSSSTALCTPIFPAIGFINLCARFAIPDPNLRAKFNASLGTIFNIAFYYILPFGMEYSPLLLPCAIGNGIVAGGAYALLDTASRTIPPALSSSINPAWGQRLMQNPLVAGGGIGATTGLIAPHLYGSICETLYGVEGLSNSLSSLMDSFPFFLQISTTTGFAAGVMMYPILHYPIHGIQHVKWQGFSGVLLLASGMTVYYMYRPEGMQDNLVCPDGAFVDRSLVPLLSAIVRYRVSEGKFGAYSMEGGGWLGEPGLKDKGQMIADGVRRYHAPGWWDSSSDDGGGGKNYTFDNQILAFYCSWCDRGLGEKHKDRLVHVLDVKELQAYEDSMFRTDWAVKGIIEMNTESPIAFLHNQEKDEIRMKDEAMREKIRQMKAYGSAMSDRACKRRVESIEATSVAVQLLMTMRQVESAHDGGIDSIINATNTTPIAVADLEGIVRKRAPDILLYKIEETKKGVQGQSVESQLEKLRWKAPALDDALAKWQKLQGAERGRKIRNGLLITSGLITSGIIALI